MQRKGLEWAGWFDQLLPGLRTAFEGIPSRGY